MKGIHITAGWLVVAAALTTGMTACSGDDSIIDVPNTTTTLPPTKYTDLSTLADGEYVAQDGEVLTGTLDGETQKVKVCIAPGATVTLHDATIRGKDDGEEENLWAGITAQGNATIVLEGTNSVTNFNRYYPAIQPAHNDTGSGTEYTLTILGSGSLTATNENSGAAIGTIYGKTCGNISIEGGTIYAQAANSAAIGAGESATCGSINISGGDITANGGYGGAGIGCGYSYTSACGDITITGGTITATGGESGAGIGSGDTGTSGNIAISGGTITATGGENGAGIGTGKLGTCGNINISGGTIMAVGGSGAAGIGTGYGEDEQKAVCGDISISRGESFVSVTAIRGDDANRSIGPSQDFLEYGYKCGKIYFGIELVYDGKYGYYNTPDNAIYGYELRFVKYDAEDNETDSEGVKWVLTPFTE